MDKIEQLLQFLAEEPGDSFTQYALALEYEKAGDTAAAINWLNTLLEEHPDYLPAFYQYGRLLEQTGKKTSAIETYEKGLKLAKVKGNKHTANELQTAIDLLTDD